MELPVSLNLSIISHFIVTKKVNVPLINHESVVLVTNSIAFIIRFKPVKFLK